MRVSAGVWVGLCGLLGCGDSAGGPATGAGDSSGAALSSGTALPGGTSGPGSSGEATSEATPTSTGMGTTNAMQAVCGDGVVDEGEACDDGNAEDRDGCSNACSRDYVPDPVTMGMDLPGVLPVLRVNVGGQTIEKDVEIPGTIEVFEAHDGTLTDLDDLVPTLSSKIAFEGRGNFTWTLPKKGFALELQDDKGDGVDLELLGLPAGSDFALYACYTDKTCMRNALVFALGQELGVWHPRTRFVELFIDGDYRGLYMLWERVRREDTRCDVDKPAATAMDGDVSGGYILRHEGGGKGPEVVDGVMYPQDFSTASGLIYTYHYPSASKLTAEQSAYLPAYMQDFEDAMQVDPAGHAGWIDVGTWVDHAIVEELTNNWDGYVHSIYMTKESEEDGGLLGMGPLWDFDLAFANGNVTGYNCATDNWAYQNVRGAPDDMPKYWLALFADPGFQAAFKCRWQELRGGAIGGEGFAARVATWTAFTAQARARDQVRWPTVGMMIFPNCFSHPSYEEEVAGLLQWIDARIAWLDGQVAGMPGTCP
jgi:cysteine-rich repeat protein